MKNLIIILAIMLSPLSMAATWYDNDLSITYNPVGDGWWQSGFYWANDDYFNGSDRFTYNDPTKVKQEPVVQQSPETTLGSIVKNVDGKLTVFWIGADGSITDGGVLTFHDSDYNWNTPG